MRPDGCPDPAGVNSGAVVVTISATNALLPKKLLACILGLQVLSRRLVLGLAGHVETAHFHGNCAKCRSDNQIFAVQAIR